MNQEDMLFWKMVPWGGIEFTVTTIDESILRIASYKPEESF